MPGAQINSSRAWHAQHVCLLAALTVKGKLDLAGCWRCGPLDHGRETKASTRMCAHMLLIRPKAHLRRDLVCVKRQTGIVPSAEQRAEAGQYKRSLDAAHPTDGGSGPKHHQLEESLRAVTLIMSTTTVVLAEF